jgi:hypothetical protein
MCYFAPLRLQAMSITHRGNEAALIRLSGALPALSSRLAGMYGNVILTSASLCGRLARKGGGDATEHVALS